MAARWAHSLAPVIVHVVATSPDEVARCAGALDRCEGVAGIELGLHDQATPDDIAAILQAANDNTLLPLLVQVPLYSAVESAQRGGTGRGRWVGGRQSPARHDPRFRKRAVGRRARVWSLAQAAGVTRGGAGRAGRVDPGDRRAAAFIRRTTRGIFWTRARRPCRSIP